jgi:hypothetical protein
MAVIFMQHLSIDDAQRAAYVINSRQGSPKTEESSDSGHSSSLAWALTT